MNSRRFNISQAQVDDASKKRFGCRDRRANDGGPQLTHRPDLARQALNLPFDDISFANSAAIKVNATKLGIHTADV